MASKVEIMGIVNLTPDSFSDGGKYDTRAEAVEHFRNLIAAGANVVDLGAVATGPGSVLVSNDDEISRLRLILESDFFENYGHKIKVSVDTFRSDVARYALGKGASIINDISGCRADIEMLKVIAEFKAEIVIMYSRVGINFPHASSEPIEYSSITDTITNFFEERIEFALQNGVDKSKIILDPGMGGFLSPNTEYSWEVIRNLKILKEKFKDHRLLYGVSRKKFIREMGNNLEIDFATKVVELGLCQNGVDIVRTHEVAMLKSMLKIADKAAVVPKKQ